MMDSVYQGCPQRFIPGAKLTLTAILGIFLVCNLNAQDFARVLNWQPTPTTIHTIDGKEIQQPTFTGASHRESLNLLPVYQEKIALAYPGDVKAQLLNPVYAPVSGLDKASVDLIKETADVKATLTLQRKKPYAVVQILPFRKTAGGQVERLQSFTLRVSVNPANEARATNDYAANSVLNSGTWFKIAVSSEGVFKVDYNFVKNTLKVDPASFNLNTLAIFGNGGGMVPDKNSIARPDDLLENPTTVVDNNGNNKMDEGDYLLFYAQMPDAWRFNTVTQTFYHEKNLYTDKTFYFLTPNAGTGKRVQTAGADGTANKTITEFDDHAYHDVDELSPKESGKTWIGDKMTSYANIKNFSFNFPNLITSSPVKVISSLASRTGYGSNTTVTLNGQTIFTHSDGGISPATTYPPGAVVSTLTANYNANSDQLNMGYTFNVSYDPTGNAATYIDYFELHVKRRLTMAGNLMLFRSIASLGSGSVSNFQLQNASSSIQIWDVTDLGNIRRMNTTLSGSQLSFTAATDNLREFMAFDPNAGYPSPEFVQNVENQNLHAIGEPDLIIVAYDDFVAPAQDLAAWHQSRDGISGTVVKVSKIYNEFGSGRPDISAIRDFVRMLYDRAGNDTAIMPRYLLLMGDGSYDPKDRIAGNQNFIPCYESYEWISETATFTSDDFFGLLDANEGGDINSDQSMDLAVGRLPVATEQEAWEVVNKIKNYKNPQVSASCVSITSNNSWRNNVTFVADDEDGDIHLDSSDFLAENTRSQHPAYNFDKIYLDAYKQQPTPAGDRYPDVNTAILNKINSGTLILNWVGHGGPTNWAHERIFNQSDISQLNNKERLPLFVTATCEFSRFDLPTRTAGEMLITNGKGGAIASVTTVRLVYSSANAALNNTVFEYMFEPYEGREPTLGEIMMETKNNVNTEISNTRKFVLLGDPALTLNYPRYNVVATQVNNKPVNLPHDTLKALSQITIKGEVRDDNGNKLTSFNGVVFPLVFDKISNVQTLGNDPTSYVRVFKIYKNILFKGKASVANGEFSFSFIVPKDIDYQFGPGRVSFYADNGNGTDAHGYSSDVIIGGSADSFQADGIGPKLKLYMNDENFVFGGLTNSSPILLVNLEDETGINTTGTGIGHDLTAVLDANTQNMVVLNDYYESELDNYKRGSVKYPYSKLADGKHTLKVKAWDIYNNSSEDYTEFVVASDAKLALTHVLNYPNPFTTHTQFMFEHNKPCEDLRVTVQIYTVSGRIVKNIVQDVHCNGFRTDDVEWDGRDDYGDAIGKGVYVYKLSVRDPDGNTAHKFEKLVVLR